MRCSHSAIILTLGKFLSPNLFATFIATGEFLILAVIFFLVGVIFLSVLLGVVFQFVGTLLLLKIGFIGSFLVLVKIPGWVTLTSTFMGLAPRSSSLTLGVIFSTTVAARLLYGFAFSSFRLA